MSVDQGVIDELHKILVKDNHPMVDGKTLDYTGDLYSDICESFVDYFQTGWTVCGAQDPAVIYIGDKFGKKYPELASFSVVRVIDKYLNEWSSATLLEFSNRDMTDQEYVWYEEVMKEEV